MKTFKQLVLEHEVHVKHYEEYGSSGTKQMKSRDFHKHVKKHGGKASDVTDKGVVFKFKNEGDAKRFHQGIQSTFKDLGSDMDNE